MKILERLLGFGLLAVLLFFGLSFLKSDMLFFRLLIGLGLGYTLARAYTGFAGSINRAYITGSTKLMRTLMFMFFITALLTAGLLFKQDVAASYKLWINPINFGLLAGGFLFGFGMAFSSCCASGVLTDLSAALPRAFITLVFFGLGAFLGLPLQNTAPWVKQSWITSETGAKFSGGVFFPDWFKNDGMGGYLGALALTALFCAIVIFISYMYEKKRKLTNTYHNVPAEVMQLSVRKEELKVSEFQLLSDATYNHVFVRPWSLKQGAIVLAILFTILMGVTKSGWGASGPYAIWFGKLIMLFGVSAESLAEFAKTKPAAFLAPLLQNGITVQDFGIILGALIYLLTASKFKETFTQELRISFKEALLFALGGITMGFGTRLANGCNVGALYTPIANFSLSGWIFFVVLVVGGITGNIINKAALRKK